MKVAIVISQSIVVDELATSLVVSQSVGAPALGSPSTLIAASLEVQASLADTHSPPWMVQLNFTDAEARGWMVMIGNRTTTTFLLRPSLRSLLDASPPH